MSDESSQHGWSPALLMFCQECGRQLRETARFCNQCGATVKQRFSGAGDPLPSAPLVQAKPAVPAQTDVHPLAEEPHSDVDEAPMIIPVIAPVQTRTIRKAKHTVFEPLPPKLSPKDSTLPSPSPERANSHVNPAGNHTASHYSAPPPVSFPADASSHQTFFTRAMPALVNPRHNRLVRATTLLLLAFLVVLILFYLTGKYA